MSQGPEYVCGVCGKHMERDLLLFMKHTDAHIIQTIKAKHPEWVNDSGICPKCHDYYKKQKSGD